MEGFCDQIARQYDNLITQTLLETAASSTDFVTPTQTDVTEADSWLELSGMQDEPMISTDHSATTESGLSLCRVSSHRMRISIPVESVCAATEENNKKNATNECAEQRTLIETEMNFSAPDLSSTNKTSLNILSAAQSSPNINLSTPISINLADIPVIDDESNTSTQQPPPPPPPKQSDDTSSSEDDDEEQTQLKRLKANSEQIEAPVEEDEEEDEEEQQEEVGEDLQSRRFFFLLCLFRRKKNITKNYKNNFMVNNKKLLNEIGMMISFSNDNSPVRSPLVSFI